MGVESFDNKVTGQRSTKRARVLLAARLHTPAGTVEARLRDLSRRGALLECAALPEVGTAVTFERGETCVPATVAWLADGRVGLEFEHPIHESELLIHIGRPSRAAPAPQSFSRPGIIRGMSPKDRRIAKAWSLSVGLSLPDSLSQGAAVEAAHNWTMAASSLGALDGELSTSAPEAPAKNARTARRVQVELDAGLRQRGAAAISVHVLDLSTHGFRVETHLGLAVGTPVWLRLPGLEASLAHVMWADGCLVGCAFDRPLHPAVLELIVRRSGGR